MSTEYNHREKLIAGIRERIEKEKYGWKLIRLWSWLFDAWELPC